MYAHVSYYNNFSNDSPYIMCHLECPSLTIANSDFALARIFGFGPVTVTCDPGFALNSTVTAATSFSTHCDLVAGETAWSGLEEFSCVGN